MLKFYTINALYTLPCYGATTNNATRPNIHLNKVFSKVYLHIYIIHVDHVVIHDDGGGCEEHDNQAKRYTCKICFRSQLCGICHSLLPLPQSLSRPTASLGSATSPNAEVLGRFD